MARNRKTRHAPVSLLLFMGLAALIGCDTSGIPNGVPPTGIDQRPTLNETVVAPDEEAPNVGTASVGPFPMTSITISASPVYCCNPLTFEFDADVDNSGAASTAIPEWEFGDGRTGSGLQVTHTFAWPGDFEVSLVVRMPNGSDFVIRMTHVLSVDKEGAAVVALLEEAMESEEGDLASVGGIGDVNDAELMIDAGPDLSIEQGETVILAGRVLQVSRWRENSDLLQRQQEMADLVGQNRMQEGLFVTENGYFSPSNSGRRTHMLGEALDEMSLLRVTQCVSIRAPAIGSLSPERSRTPCRNSPDSYSRLHRRNDETAASG